MVQKVRYVKDRGLKKWTPAFFVPEHVEMIKNAEIEDIKVQKPILDEYEVQEINDLLVASILDREPIQLKLWLDGFIEYIEPFIATKIDPYSRKLYGVYKDSTQSFSFDSIIGVSRI
jgi:hypothetical protein